MHSRYHLVASVLVALPSLLAGEVRVGLLALLVGWLIDADHEVDYYLLHGRLALNPLTVGNELGHLDRYGDYRIALIPLHSVELWLCTIPLTPVPVWLAYAVHLVMDWLGNAYDVRFLSLALRLRTRGYKRRRADRSRRPFDYYPERGTR